MLPISKVKKNGKQTDISYIPLKNGYQGMSDSFPEFFHPQQPPHTLAHRLLSPATLASLFTNSLSEDALEKSLYPERMRLYHGLLAHDFLLPIPMEATVSLEKNLTLLMMENDAGERGLPIFSHRDALALWAKQEVGFIVLPFSMLCNYALEAGADCIVLNVNGPFGREITRNDLTYLANSLIPPPAEKQYQSYSSHEITSQEAFFDSAFATTAAIAGNTFQEGANTSPYCETDGPLPLSGEPDLPNHLKDCLYHLFSAHPDIIQRVYLLNMAFSSGQCQTTLAIRFARRATDTWRQELFPNLRAVLTEMLETEERVVLFPLAETDQKLEEQIQRLTPAFYES
jgi:SseB protein N-terminal domain